MKCGALLLPSSLDTLRGLPQRARLGSRAYQSDALSVRKERQNNSFQFKSYTAKFFSLLSLIKGEPLEENVGYCDWPSSFSESVMSGRV